MQKTKRVARETFGDVFKKNKIVLIITASLFVATILTSTVIKLVKSGDDDFHSGLEPAVLDLTPLAVESEMSGGTVLTETAAVDDSYFANALFVGDSLCDGIRVYADIFPGYRTVTAIGLGIEATLYQEIPNVIDGQKLSAIGHIEFIKPQIVYIMIGTNDMVWNSPETMLVSYEKLVNEIMTRLPSCKIVVESITPTTLETATKRTGFSQDRIKTFNDGLKALAMKKGVYFLDVHAAIVGPDGYMPQEIAQPDGIHMKPEGYALWRDYLRTHTIQGDAAFSIGADGYIKFTRA
ncbi:MAG: GDSL-type esterase/lipase family protein [Oscillospiraceae bacterium]